MSKRRPKHPVPDSKKAAGCALLFALPFAGVGVFVAVWVVRELWFWRAVQSWVETPATVLSSELESHADDDSTTFRAKASYAYFVGGRRYIGSRVAVSTARDNIGSYHHDRARELDRVRVAGGQTVCYVDPENPAEAVLFRDLRPGLLALKLALATVFGGIGLAMLGGAWQSRTKARRREALHKLAPDKPWQSRDEWITGRIPSSTAKRFVGLAWFAAFWNAVSWPAAILALSAEDFELWKLAVVGMFPLVGAGLATWAGYLWLARRKWGASEFEMAAVPGVLGGALAGVVRVPRRVAPEDGFHFHLRLACVRTETKTSGGETSREDETLWDDEQTIDRDVASSEGPCTLVPVRFVVPFDLPPSGDDVRWLLSVRAATRGVDFRAEFEAPVFQTEASSPDALVETFDAAIAAPAYFATLARRLDAVLEEDLPDRRALRFPAARNRAMAAFVGSFAVVWLGITVALYFSDAPWLFPVVFSAFSVLIAWMAVHVCLVATTLEYDRRGVAYSRSVLGLRRRHDVPRDEIASVAADKSGTQYGGRSYYKIELRTHDGDRHSLVSEIARRQDAHELAADMTSVLTLADSRTAPRSSRMPLDAELPGDFRAG